MTRAAWLLALLLLVPAPAHAQPAPATRLPDACHATAEGAECEWWLNNTLGTRRSERFAIPVFERTLGTIVVTVNGRDAGWSYAIFREREAENRTSIRPVSFAEHRGAGDPVDTYVRDSFSHLLEALPGDAFELRFTVNEGTGGVTPLNQEGVVRPASVHVRYLAAPLPLGVPPERPAATRDVPHLRDLARDSRVPEADILAVWFDDARLGDGAFEVTLLVANLTNVDYNFSLPREASSGANRNVQWHVRFHVRDEAYDLVYARSGSTLGPQGGFAFLGWFCGLYDGKRELQTSPLCDVDEANGTIRWEVPESSLGSPGPGVPFRDVRATVERRAFMGGAQYYATVEDDAEGEQFPFALGGPAVWDGLNGCAFCPAPVAPAAFYQDPLAPHNLADSLQVAGALLAGLTFVVGLVALRRSRRQTKALLLRVDALVAHHERDSREALLALGRLEAEFARLYREGRINETQYQVASQRLVAAATRMAMRRELGLDDGTPQA